MVDAKVRAALVLSLALVLVPAALAAPASQQRTTGALPTRGVLVVGKSLAGISLGATQATVKQRWGSRYVNCTKSPCTDPTWLYFYPSGEPVGAGVRFRNNKAVAIFTLGATPGWKSTEGIKIGDHINTLYSFYDNPKFTICTGYSTNAIIR